MKLSAFGSLATSAFDTARSTIKAMAEAAQAEGRTGPAGSSSGGPAAAPSSAALVPAKPIEAAVAAAEAAPPKPAAAGRVGTRLDALA
jgi:hypothetical protein